MTAAARTVRVLSASGEHSAIWLAMCAAGGALDRPRAAHWSRAGATVLQAHLASMVLKRVFRLRRPPVELRRVSVASEWTFPSSHATGSAAAVVALRGLVPVPLVGAVAVAVAGSRVVLRVHRPRDLVGGAVLGAGWAGLRAARLPARP